MSDEPVYFGLLPAGNVTFSKNTKSGKGQIYRDFCGNHTDIGLDNNCDTDYSRKQLHDMYKKECAGKKNCKLDLTAPINMMSFINSNCANKYANAYI